MTTEAPGAKELKSFRIGERQTLDMTTLQCCTGSITSLADPVTPPPQLHILPFRCQNDHGA